MNALLDLAVVMPVYNEAACIAAVVARWHAVLAAEGMRFKLLVLNDGSRDGTAQALAPFVGQPWFELVNKPNSGHGPTILLGYRRVVGAAEWVFQCDSDDEMPAEAFPALWRARGHYDFLLGTRQGRAQNAARRLISRASRLTVRAVFGPGVQDVNTPYRLMRAAALAPLLARIPASIFAPNVLLSGLAARRRLRILNRPVPHVPRRTGAVSIVRWRLWRAAALAFVQTVLFALGLLGT